MFDDGLARQIVGFYDTLRVAGPVMILAPILGAVGVDTRDGIAPDPIAMGCELVPAYIAADPAGQATLAATADTFASVALVTNAARRLPRLRRARCAVHGGHPDHAGTAALDQLARAAGRGAPWLVGAPESSVVGGRRFSTIGFIGFVVFMPSMGIALLRSRSKVDEAIRHHHQN